MENVICIVETPKGSGIKFEYNTKLAWFQLGKVLPAGVSFPYDFGYIPGTLGEDGDPLDVVIIADLPCFTGCAVDCRIIGGIKAMQVETDGSEVRNDRFLAIPVKDSNAESIEEMDQLPAQKLDELEQFFINYNEQAGKTFTPLGRMNAATAFKRIKKAREKTGAGKLIQLLLPIYDAKGKAFSARLFKTVKKELAKKFGGITCYVRSPALGLWENKKDKLVRDDIIVYEVMAAEIDRSYWKKYKKELRQLFQQDDILIRQSQIGLL